MPLDQAIWHPTRQSIFAVRGGRIYELSTAGAVLNQSDFLTPAFGKACLCYDSGLDRIFAAAWNNPSFVLAGPANVVSRRGIYRIVPSSLAVDATYGFESEFSVSDNQYCIREEGITEMVDVGGTIYASYWFANSGFVQATFGVLKFLAATPGTFTKPGTISSGGYHSISQGTPSGNETVYAVDVVSAQITGYDFTATAFVNGTSDYSKVFLSPCYCPDNGVVYVTDQAQFIYTANSAGILASTLNTGRAAFNGLNIRWNPNNHLLYAAGYGDNTIVTIDPNNADAIVVKSGYDLPLDFVFTPTQQFAVQQGAQGIKLIT